MPKCPRKCCFYDLSNPSRCTKQEDLTRRTVCIQFSAQFCKFTWQNHHLESSVATLGALLTPRENRDSPTCPMCCKSIQRPKHTVGPCAGSSAHREIPVHPWTGERGRHTTEGSLFAPPFADEMGLQQTLGLLPTCPCHRDTKGPHAQH